MKRKRGTALAAAGALMLSLAGNLTAASSEIQIIGETDISSESEEETAGISPQRLHAASEISGETESEGTASSRPLNPSEEGITAQDAVEGARTLYSQMQHYADVNDNENFAALFESGADAQTVQNQLQAVKSSLTELDSLDSHYDLCFFDPTSDATQSPYYFAVALCDYNVDEDGAVSWYSTLMRTAEYDDGWKISLMSPEGLLSQLYPEAYTKAQQSGRNVYDLYPSLAMRFYDDAVFEDALYALPNLVWQEEDGSVSCAVWVANGTQTPKWCDSTDLVITDDELGEVASVNVPVQQALEGGQSALVTCTVPAEYVDTDTQAWTGISIDSNLRYQ